MKMHGSYMQNVELAWYLKSYLMLRANIHEATTMFLNSPILPLLFHV